MSVIGIIFIVIALGLIVSAALLIKQSAKKFKLSEDQLNKINERNEALEKEEQKEDQ